jgi:hypothetical protein
MVIDEKCRQQICQGLSRAAELASTPIRMTTKTSSAAALTHYKSPLADIKARVQASQTRAVLSVNAELVRLYWDIGRLLGAQ